MMSLLDRTRTGLREMPANAAWLLSGALKPADGVGEKSESATSSLRDRGRRVRAAMVDAAPGDGNSVEIRMRRAQEASERAREAEKRAVEAEQEAQECADQARKVSADGRARVTAVERDTAKWVKERVAEAQKAADESVKQERQAAEADAEEQRQETQAEVAGEIEEAEGEAEAAQQEAEERVEDATEKMAEARQLAQEATDAAQAAADEAHRQAQELAQQADQQTSEAKAQVTQAERIRTQSETTAKKAAGKLGGSATNGDLESYNKPELVELAAGIGIEGRTTMNKDELVTAIKKESR